ncbi:MAG: SdrD B-like domain-containing protein [Spirosomataceae bacterium]
MKKLLYSLLLLFIGLVSPAAVFSQTITGTVFQDINFNGVKDATDPGVAGVIIYAFDDNDPIGTPTATATSAATGVYTLSGLSAAVKYRLEAKNPNAWLFPGPNGTGSQTTVRIATAGATGINFGLVTPTDFCQTVPNVIVPCYVSGNPLGGGTAGSEDALIMFGYNNSGTSGTMTHLATANKIGTVWGTAYQRETNMAFSTAFLKRHAGIGPGGLGAIYRTDVATFNSTVVYANLSTLGVTLAAPADLTYINTTRNGQLPSVSTSSSQDAQVFPLIGKVGMGGMDISPNGDTLWIVNLYEKKLIRILLGNPYKASLTAADVTQFTIPDPGCASGSWRPWAVRYDKGKIYVGGICDAGTAGARSNLRAYVYTFNPSAGTFNGTPVIQYPLDYTKGATHTGDAAIGKNWEPWRDTWADMFKGGVLSAGTRTARPQPILSDIDFDESGNMLMTFTDRGGHQLGVGQQAIPDDTKRYNGYINGDLLISKDNGNGTFTLESNGAITGKTGSGVGNGQGPGGGEFFANDLYPVSGSVIHQETVIGATLILPGKNEAMVISMDPLNVWTGGVNVSNLTTGANIRRYQIYSTGPGSNGSQGKANGLGLTVPNCSPAPIEIGNLIWLDSDGDGIQDPGENGIVGVTVELRKADNTLVSTAVTDANGFYLFSNATGTSTGSAKYGLTGLTYFTGYKVVIPNVSGGSKQSSLGTNVLTQNDNGGADALADLRDSDGTVSGTNAQTANFTTGSGAQNNHTFDFGFKPFVAPQPSAPCTSISGLSSNLTTVCTSASSIDFTITHDASLTPSQTIKLVYSTTSLTAAQLYSGSGTVLQGGIAPVTGQTSKLVTASMPANGGASPVSYFVYAVLETAPADPDCRPFGSVSPITVNPVVAPATLSGTYFEICDRDDATTSPAVENVKNLNSLVSGNVSGIWSVSGSPAMTGTFSGGIYTAASADAGKTFTFTYTLNGTGPAGTDCATKTYTVTIKVNACPCYTTQSICTGETVKAQVPDAGYTVTWYKENGVTDIQVGAPGDDFINITTTGEYYYTGTDQNGCAVELCCRILITGNNTTPAVINMNQQTICNVNRPSTVGNDNEIDLDNQFVSGNTGGTWALAPSSPAAAGTFNSTTNVFTAASSDAGKTLIFRYTIPGSAGCPDLTYDVPVLVNSCDCPTFTSITTPGTVCSDEKYSLTLLHTDAPQGGNVQFYYNTNSTLVAADLYAPAHGLSTLIGTVPIGNAGVTTLNNVQLPAVGTSITYYIYAIYVPSPAIANCQPFVVGTPASVTVQGPTVPATVGAPAPLCNVTSGNNDNVLNLMTLVTGNTNGTWSSGNPTAQAAISGNVFTATAGMAGQTFTLTYTVHGASGSQTSACGDLVYTMDITIKDCSCPSVDILTTTATPSTVCSNETFSVAINHRSNPGNLQLYYIEDVGNDGTELTAAQLYSVGNGGATALGAPIAPAPNAIVSSLSGLSLPVNTSGVAKNYIIYVRLAAGNSNINNPNCQPVSQRLITVFPETPTATVTTAAQVCESSYSTNQNIINLNSLITAGYTGGTWIDTGNSGGLSGSTFTASPSMAGSNFTFTYKINGIGSGNCGDRTYTVTVSVKNCAIPNCGTITSIAPVTEAICSDSPFSVVIQHTAGIGAMSLYWGETTAYNNYDFYTDGFDNADVHFLANITPASGVATSTTASGLTLPVYNGVSPRDVYLYVVLKSDNGNRVIPFCIPYAYNTMQQDPAYQANAGTDGSMPVCDGSTAVIDLFSIIIGEQTGGTWSRLTGTGGTFNAGAGTFTPAAGSSTSTFRYVIPGQFSCPGDTSVATVTMIPKPMAGIDQIVCAGQTATLTGTNPTTGTWSAQVSPANPAGATLSTTAAGVATVSFAPTSSGIFNFVYTANGCTDTVQVTVTAKPSAGADQTGICAGQTATLTGTNPATGTWIAQASPANPAGATLSTTAAGVATVSFAPTAAGLYRFVYNVNGCTDTVQVSVTAKPNAGIDQIVCAGQTATLIGTGTVPGTWSAQASPANPAGATLTTVSPGVATVKFDLNVSGNYRFVYTVNGCTDTVQVTVTAKPNAGNDQTGICAGNTASLTGTGTTPGTWSAQASPANPAGAILTATSPGAAVVSFAPTASGIYRFVYTVNGCTDTVQVNVTAKPSGGVDQIVCAGQTATLTATNPTTGTWSAQASPANPAGATLSLTTAGVATVSFASTASGVFKFVYTADNCRDTVQITVNSKPIAGNDIVGVAAICNTVGTVDLPNAANGESWTQLGSTPKAVTINASTGVVTGMDMIGTYQFILKNPTTGCADTVAVETKNCLKGSLGDFVWKDFNDNGIQDSPSSEPGIKGIIVQLINADNNTVIATDTTGDNGAYGFTGLDSGNYKVKIVKSSIPVNCAITPRKDIGSDTADSDFDPTTGESPVIVINTLGTGIQKDNPTIDAGLVQPCIKPTWQVTTAPACSPVAAVYSVSFAVTNKNGDLKVNQGNLSFNNNIYTVTNIPVGVNLTITDSLRANCKYDTTIVAPDCSCPQITLLTPNATACKGDTIPTLRIFLAGNSNGVGVEWYSALTGGVLLGTGFNFKPSGILTATTTYYIQLTGTTGNCINQPRTPVTVTAQDCKVDLALKKSINTKIAQIGDIMTYTLKVWNESGTNASGVEVTDSVATTAQFMTGSFVASRGSASISSSVIKWTIGSIAANGDTVTLTYQVKATQQGIHFNTAEISKIDQQDTDSTPGNGTDGEDDIDRQCFSVPVKICAAEKIEASVPAKYLNVQWYKDGGNTVIATGNTVLLSGEGIYTFTATNNVCPAGGCCPIIIEPAPNCCPEDLCVPFTIKQTKKAGKRI